MLRFGGIMKLHHLLLAPSNVDMRNGFPGINGPTSKTGFLWKELYALAKVPIPTWAWALNEPTDHKSNKTVVGELREAVPDILAKIPERANIVIGSEELLQIFLNRKQIDKWCGQPYEAHNRTWWPILDMYRIEQCPALLEPVAKFVSRAWAGSKGKWKPKEFNIPIRYNSMDGMSAQFTMAVDIETDYDDAPLPYKKFRCIAFANDFGAWVFDKVPEKLLRELQHSVAQNGLFDWSALRGMGHETPPLTVDTMQLAHHIWPGMPADLGFLGAYLTDYPRWKAPDRSSFKEEMEYCGRDAYITWLIHKEMLPRALPWFEEQTMKNVNVAIDICVQGVPISASALDNHRENLTRVATLEKAKLVDMASQAGFPGFEPSKPSHLAGLFGKTMGAPVVARTDGGKPAYDKGALTLYCASGDPGVEAIARSLLTLRKYQKLKEAFIDHLPVRGGKVYPQFKPAGAITGRWTCAKPNIQQLPRPNVDSYGNSIPGLRNLFAEEGWWVVCCDSAQEELICMAAVSGDEKMLEAANAGRDMHRMNAQALFNCAEEGVTKQQRTMAKIAGLATGYGAVSKTLQEQLAPSYAGITLRMCDEMIANYFASYPGVAKWHEIVLEFARKNKYIEKHLSKERIPFYGFIKPNEVYNVPIQGLASDLLSLFLRDVEKHVDGVKHKWLGTIHDEIALFSRDPVAAAKILSDAMNRTIIVEGREARFRCEVKLGTDWGKTKEFPAEGDFLDKIDAYVRDK
jgi:DNA polymerase I-like protein with 3'-5' exonuclease and polymerase domains